MQTLWGTSAALGLAVLLTACAPPDSTTPAANTPAPTPPPAAAPTPTPTPSPVASASYHVILNWTAPSTRADGTALQLSDLTGYRVYYLLEGTDSSKDTVVPVNGGNVTTLSLTLTAAGSYTFAITAIDRNGLESGLSSAISVPIN